MKTQIRKLLDDRIDILNRNTVDVPPRTTGLQISEHHPSPHSGQFSRPLFVYGLSLAIQPGQAY